MKPRKSNLCMQLQEYFKNTPKEQLDKDWDESKFWNEVGPDVSVYCKENWKRDE